MSEQAEKDPFEELANIFQDAANAARRAWLHARENVERAEEDKGLYRELATYGSAALDSLNRAVKMAWANAKE